MRDNIFGLPLNVVGKKAYQEGESTRGPQRSVRQKEPAKAAEPSGLRQLLRGRPRRPDLPDAAHGRGRPRLPGARSVLRPPGRLRRALRSEPHRDDAERHSPNAHPAGQTGGPADDVVLLVGRTEPRARRDPLQGRLTPTIEAANLLGTR